MNGPLDLHGQKGLLSNSRIAPIMGAAWVVASGMDTMEQKEILGTGGRKGV